MGFKVKVNIPKVDKGKTAKQFDKEMKAYSLNALRDWVMTSTDIIPVWSGATKASFLQAASAARLPLEISPVAPDPPGSRIDLGVQESQFTIFASPNGGYGWEWSSDLFYIEIVNDRVKFIEAGIQALQGLASPKLSQPVYKAKGTQG